MPIQRLAGQWETEGFKGPTALDQIDARRAARKAEELEKFKADTQRMTADEYTAAGQHGRSKTDAMEKYAQGGPPMPTQEQGPHAVVEALRQRAAYLAQSPYAEHQQKATNLINGLEQFIKSGKGGTGTLTERNFEGEMDLNASMAEKNRADAGYIRAGKPGSTKPDNLTIPQQIDTEEKLFGYSNANLTSFFPNIEVDDSDPDNVTMPRLDGTSRKFFYETFKAELDRVTEGQGSKAVDPSIVNSTFKRVASRYKVIEYDPIGFGDSQVLIPLVIYDRLKQAMGGESAKDVDIAAEYLTKIKGE